MMPITIFGISGLAIILLLATKKLGQKRKKHFFVSKIISKGDIYTRKLYHLSLHLYSEKKEEVLFIFRKKIPMHSRNSFNKLAAFLKEKRSQYVESMRDTRLLKKSDGLSEFFQSLSSIEKGNGEIHETVDGGSQDHKKRVE